LHSLWLKCDDHLKSLKTSFCIIPAIVLSKPGIAAICIDLSRDSNRCFAMKFLLRTVSALTALTVVTSAHAADLGARVYTKAPVAPAFSWTGFYLSGGGGYGMWDGRQQFMVQGVPTGDSEHTGGRGYFGTVGGGYDWQLNSRWVGGVFADAQFGNMSGSISIPFADVYGSTKNDLNYAAGARLGYLVAPNVLSYINAGYSHAEFTGGNLFSHEGDSLPLSTAKFSRDGWFVGGGFENSLNIFGITAPGWFMKSEYRVAEYGGGKDVVIAGAPPRADIQFKPTIQTVSTSLVYRFNADGVPAPVSAPLYTKAPAASASNWTGFYIGAGGGYGLSTADSRTLDTGVPVDVSIRSGGSGAFGTVSGGFDQQLNNSWVAGIFADAQFGNISQTMSSPEVLAITGTAENDLNYAAGLRVGYLVAPNVLSYVNSGYSHADFKGAYLSSIGTPGIEAYTRRTHFDGWFVGGGIENSLDIFGITAPGWFMKTEYRVAEYNRKNIDLTDPPGTPFGVALAFKPYVQTISSSLVYRFNLGGPLVAKY
jgi:outer membrane immunogenic protein